MRPICEYLRGLDQLAELVVRIKLNKINASIGRSLGRFLNQPISVEALFEPPNMAVLKGLLQPADVVLVEGTTRVSVAIKYLTQSTWSHAALVVRDPNNVEEIRLVEADTVDGVRMVDIDSYRDDHIRICRPVSLTEAERAAVSDYACERIGQSYDLKNIFDLARYLFPTPPVPVRWRRKMLSFGSGDPTRAICSTLIAQAFQSVRYPILPILARDKARNGGELLRLRHHSLFVPRDFDVSPYFQTIKPTLTPDFDHHRLLWED